MSDRRQADLRRWHKQGKFTDSELAWLTPIWPEGLALLRLAERGGLSVDDVAVPGVPPSKGGVSGRSHRGDQTNRPLCDRSVNDQGSRS